MASGVRSAELCAALASYDSATIANAVEAFGCRDRAEGFASLELRCQLPELPPMVGYAVTCTHDSTTRGPRARTRLGELLDLLATAPKPAVVVCRDAGGDRGRGCFVGDVLATLFQQLGAVGVVTDSGCRDLAGIGRRAPGFQIFSPGCVVSHGNGGILEVDVAVEIGGLLVEPGELLHGDANGVVSVPLAVAEAVPAEAERVLAREEELVRLARGDGVALAELKAALGVDSH